MTIQGRRAEAVRPEFQVSVFLTTQGRRGTRRARNFEQPIYDYYQK
jgi:hypothetical protein